MLTLWSTSTRKTSELDTNVQDPTFVAWSTNGTNLAIGTGKGNLQMYNSITRKKTPFLGKHPKDVVCGDWSQDDDGKNELVLGSSDGTITLSKSSGETLEQVEVKNKPLKIFFDSRATKSNSSRQRDTQTTTTTIVVNLGLTIAIIDRDDVQNPTELSFQKVGTYSGYSSSIPDPDPDHHLNHFTDESQTLEIRSNH